MEFRQKSPNGIYILDVDLLWVDSTLYIEGIFMEVLFLLKDLGEISAYEK